MTSRITTLTDVVDCVKLHDKTIRSRIDLVASNAWTSNWSRRCLGSTLCNNYSIGHPGQRLYGGCEAIDNLEELVHKLTTEIFQTRHSCLQLLSGMQANFAAYDAFLKPGDTVVTALCRHGGHYSHNKDGPLRLYRSHILPIPFNTETYNIDTERLTDMLKKEQPRLLVIGWSEFLFPHPLKKIREGCDRYGTKLMYDMSHVAGLIAGGEFQADASEFADVITSSTGKSLHAPDHGLCLFNDSELGQAINRAVQPLLTSNTHPHEIAALGVALAEMKTFGKAYAKQVIRNAQALGRALEQRGVRTLYGSMGYTQSHTILVQIEDGAARDYVRYLNEAGITANGCALPWDEGSQESGLRLGTQVVTRRGMQEAEMERIAEAISSLVIEKTDSRVVFNDLVKPLALSFQGVAYSFDSTANSSMVTSLEESVWIARQAEIQELRTSNTIGLRERLYRFAKQLQQN